MIEFVMVVPLLALVIGLTFFFGKAMMDQQHVRISARYTAWNGMQNDEPNGLNQRFFGDRAEGVAIHGGRGPLDTLEYLVDGADQVSREAGEYAEESVLRRFPKGWRGYVSAEFPSDVGAWQSFTGAIEREHLRDGVSWKRGQCSPSSAIVELFLEDLDEALENVSAPGEELAQTVRNLYRHGW
jgi:hypothetical protein